MHALADLVRSMNCYYSNLIEGHDTHPIDIERALRQDYSAEPEKRNLQLEAAAHIAVQAWIDGGALRGRATEADALQEVHRRFCALLPADLLVVRDPRTDERLSIVPGEFRLRDVEVGRHVAVSPGAVPRFLRRFEEAYRRLGRVDSILAAAAAHHRLAWIHPFLDGNGRVGRLMTHAMLLHALDTGGVWSVARGLARSERAYKDHLAACDLPRRNDLDGRGSLSEEALAAFTTYFLETCIDQVRFMRGLVEPEALRSRIMRWAEDETRADRLPLRASTVLEALLYRGELPRGDVAALLGVTDRQARRVTSALLDRDVLVADGPRAPLRLAFPARLASVWMPGLFPVSPSA
jgi:Fic family protein